MHWLVFFSLARVPSRVSADIDFRCWAPDFVVQRPNRSRFEGIALDEDDDFVAPIGGEALDAFPREGIA